jgi:hypothetical protein
VNVRAAGVAALGLGVAVATVGCGLTNLQTARTVPAGETRTTIGAGVIHNGDRNLGGGVSAIPVDVMVRHGVTERVDWGVRLFLGAGLLGDAKWNLLGPDSRTALAISAGLGAAASPNIQDQGWIEAASIPVTVTLSQALPHGLTPYGALGYGAYWIFNYRASDPSAHDAARSWTGDGLLGLHVGLELAAASGRAVLLEYVYARPVVDDPGDRYAFATNQFLMIGFHTGGGAQPLMAR